MTNTTIISDGDWEIIRTPNTLTAPSAHKAKFPTTLADLQPTNADPYAHTNIYASLKSLRKSTLSIHNRLASILSDSLFVQAVASHYKLPLVANERCGSWYIPTHLKAE